MAGSINSVTLVGNVGKDPDIRSFSNGDRVANLSVATSETWRDKASGERKEKTEWHRVTILNEHVVKVVENYVKKGSTVGIQGSLQTRKYEQNGVEKYSTEIVVGKFKGELTMLGGKAEKTDDDYTAGFSTGGGSSSGKAKAESYDLNDDIPFVRMASDGDV